MESKKNGNPATLVAFFLVVTVLIGAIAFSVSGWQGDNSGKSDSGNSDGGDNTAASGDADENKDGAGDPDEAPVVSPSPVYTHYITGLEITKDESMIKPLCIVFDTEAPMYGISSSFLTVEIPVEGGKTRLLAFSNDATTQGKLGSIAPTRKYISNIAGYFGAVAVYAGEDDSFSYSGLHNVDAEIDFLSTSGYHYTEYGKYSYTNEALLNAYIKNNNISMVMGKEITLPYVFGSSTDTKDAADDDESERISANTVLIPFNGSSTTELIYSESDGKYHVKKNSSPVTDRINEKALAYDNAFILYGNSVTHETADATQLIYDTISGGAGYYISSGNAVKITWSTTESGNMTFRDESGSILLINPGTSYIAFSKASQINNTKFS